MTNTDDLSPSMRAMLEADRSRAKFSGHGKARGAAGYINPDDVTVACDFLDRLDQSLSISPPPGGFGPIHIGLAWDEGEDQKTGFLGRFVGGGRKPVDLDLGCLYELQTGERGALQPFGNDHGAVDAPPWIFLSGDERTGRSEGEDEYLTVSGSKWPQIKRILVYVYIYSGVPDWEAVKPQIQLRVPGENPMIVGLHTTRDDMRLCALAGLENVRNGIRLTNHTEYFPGHAEMDRAFGFGLTWDSGAKDGARPPGD